MVEAVSLVLLRMVVAISLGVLVVEGLSFEDQGLYHGMMNWIGRAGPCAPGADAWREISGCGRVLYNL